MAVGLGSTVIYLPPTPAPGGTNTPNGQVIGQTAATVIGLFGTIATLRVDGADRPFSVSGVINDETSTTPGSWSTPVVSF
jgi:hypothetical protein